MANFIVMLGLSTIMGFSIYLSLPVVLHRRAGEMTRALLTAGAMGILIFLVADIFSDVKAFTDNGALYGYDLSFVISLSAAFLTLYFMENRSKERIVFTSTQTALIIALGIGFQNLTEGLVFGSSFSAGFLALSAVVFTGFFLQNVTEGFPIASPFVGKDDRKMGQLSGLFLLGGVPTIIGSAVGFFYDLTIYNVIFDGVAIGAIVYVIIPMLRGSFRPTGSAELDYRKQKMVYIGMLLGFVVGFIVNII